MEDLPEEEAVGWAEGGLGGSLLRESAELDVETQRETQRTPAASLSGVSAGVVRYFAGAFGASSQTPDVVLSLPTLVADNKCAVSPQGACSVAQRLTYKSHVIHAG